MQRHCSETHAYPWLAPLAFFIIMLAALALRLPGLTSSLGLDEAFSYDEYVRPGLERMLLHPYQCNNQPLSSLATWASTSLFGDGDIAMRIPALLAGMALFPVLYGFGRHAFGSRAAALLAIAALSVHLYHIAYSANFRSYSMVTLFAAATAWLITLQLERPRWIFFFGIALASFLMAYSHIVSLLLYSGWGMAIAVVALRLMEGGKWRDIRAWAPAGGAAAGLGIGFALTCIAYAPAFFLPYAIVQRLLTGAWPLYANVFISGAEQSQWLPFHRYADCVSSMTGLPFWLAVAVVVPGLWGFMGNGKTGAGVILASLLGPVAALLLANLKVEPRYTLSLLPFFCLGLGAGVVAIVKLAPDLAAAIAPSTLKWRRAIQVAVAVALPLFFGWAALHRYFEDFPHSASSFATVLWDFKSAVQAADAKAAPADLLVCTGATNEGFDHYADKLFRRGRRGPLAPEEVREVWLVSNPGSGPPDSLIGYGTPVVLDSEYRFCNLYRFTVPQGLRRLGEAPAWSLNLYDMATRGDVVGAEGVTWFESGGGWSDAALRLPNITCKQGHIVSFRVWINQAEVAAEISVRLLFLEPGAGGVQQFTLSYEPRPAEHAGEDWRLYQIDGLVPAGVHTLIPEVRWRGRLGPGQRIGLRDAEVWGTW